MTRWTHDEVRELYKRIEENAALALKEKERADKVEEMLSKGARDFYFPRVGDRIVLAADWQFSLYSEERNKTALELINKTAPSYGKPVPKNTCYDFMIPAGEELVIDRVYVKHNVCDYDSLTFRWKRTSVNAKGKVAQKSIRFWAKLEDVNNIRFTRKDK